jgi:hypothetical protein
VENYRLIRSLKCEGNPVATKGHHSSRFSSSGRFAMLAAMRVSIISNDSNKIQPSITL